MDSLSQSNNTEPMRQQPNQPKFIEVEKEPSVSTFDWKKSDSWRWVFYALSVLSLIAAILCGCFIWVLFRDRSFDNNYWEWQNSHHPSINVGQYSICFSGFDGRDTCYPLSNDKAKEMAQQFQNGISQLDVPFVSPLLAQDMTLQTREDSTRLSPQSLEAQTPSYPSLVEERAIPVPIAAKQYVLNKREATITSTTTTSTNYHTEIVIETPPPTPSVGFGDPSCDEAIGGINECMAYGTAKMKTCKGKNASECRCKTSDAIYNCAMPFADRSCAESLRLVGVLMLPKLEECAGKQNEAHFNMTVGHVQEDATLLQIDITNGSPFGFNLPVGLGVTALTVALAVLVL